MEADEVFSCLRAAVIDKSLACRIDFARFLNNQDWRSISVNRRDLILWTSKNGFLPPAFAQEMAIIRTMAIIDSIVRTDDASIKDTQPKTPDYLNPEHPRYTTKLAAAVLAWQAAGKTPDKPGKTPKQTIEEWLRAHVAELGLINPDGTPNATGISEIAKVANWRPTGGVPKTPG